MAANDIRAGRAYVEVYSKDNTMPGMRAIFNRLGSMSGAVARIGSMAVSALTSGAAAMSVYKAIEAGSSVKDMADRTGLAYNAVQELSYAAKQTGTDIASLETGIKLMQKAIAEGEKSISALGLSADDLRRMTPDQQFAAIAEAISRLGTPAERTKAAMDVFGKSGAELIPLLSEGAAGLDRMRQRARELGLVMSDEAVERSEALGDSIQELKDRFNALQVNVGSALLPFVEQLAAGLAEVAPHLQRFAEAIGYIADGLSDVVPSIQDSIASLLEMIADIEFSVDVAGYSASVKPFDDMRDKAKEYRDNAETTRKTARAEADERARERANRARRGAAGSLLGAGGHNALVNGFGGQALNAAMSAQNVAAKQLEEQKKANDELKRIEAAVKSNKPIGFNFG